MSKALQLLNTTTGMDSLLLVVSPIAPSSNSSSGSLASESSWIGGSNLGKEFWMGLKGGGVNGARAFRIKSQMKCETDFQKGSSNLNRSAVVPPTPPPADTSSATSGRKVKSGDVKTELNAAVRQALRFVRLFFYVTMPVNWKSGQQVAMALQKCVGRNPILSKSYTMFG